MFFKPLRGLDLQYPICADMLLSIASCQGAQLALAKRKRKEQKQSVHKVKVRLLQAVACCCFESSPSSPKHQGGYFLRRMRWSLLSMPARSRGVMHRRARVSSFGT